MPTIFNEEFLKISRDYIKKITALKNKGDKVGAIKTSYDFAKFKVSYYEQFYDPTEATSNYKKIHEDDYNWALMNLANIRDKCFELGIIEE